MKIRVLGNREKPRSQVLTRTFEIPSSILEEKIEELQKEEYDLTPIDPETGEVISEKDLILSEKDLIQGCWIPSRPNRS